MSKQAIFAALMELNDGVRLNTHGIGVWRDGKAVVYVGYGDEDHGRAPTQNINIPKTGCVEIRYLADDIFKG